MTVGDRIKQLRNQKNLTLRQLAKLAGISHTFLSDIENNRSDPSLKRLRDIAEALEVQVSYLLGEDTADKVENTAFEDSELQTFWLKLKKRKDLQKLYEKTIDLPPDSINRLLTIIKLYESK